MGALCASIRSAGALVGLGLVALGLGIRYQGAAPSVKDYVHLNQLDMPMMLILGLAYHHERRHFERHGHLAGTTRTDSLHS